MRPESGALGKFLDQLNWMPEALAFACNPSTQEAEAHGLLKAQIQPGLYCELLTQTNKQGNLPGHDLRNHETG